jgi:hypothetical protein
MLQVPRVLIASAIAGGLALAGGTSATAGPLPAPGLSASAANSFYLSFNENGAAKITVNGGPGTPLTGTQISDPSNPCPSCAVVLAYSLPEPVITGTVAISEPASAGSGITGAVRFTDSAGTISGAPTGEGAEMIYYSDLHDNALADTGLPSNLTAGNFLVGLTEASWSGYNTFDYEPGGVPYPQNDQYHYVGAGGIPEPSSLMSLGSAMTAMGLGLMIRRRRSISN